MQRFFHSRTANALVRIRARGDPYPVRVKFDTFDAPKTGRMKTSSDLISWRHCATLGLLRETMSLRQGKSHAGSNRGSFEKMLSKDEIKMNFERSSASKKVRDTYYKAPAWLKFLKSRCICGGRCSLIWNICPLLNCLCYLLSGNFAAKSWRGKALS